MIPTSSVVSRRAPGTPSPRTIPPPEKPRLASPRHRGPPTSSSVLFSSLTRGRRITPSSRRTPTRRSPRGVSLRPARQAALRSTSLTTVWTMPVIRAPTRRASIPATTTPCRLIRRTWMAIPTPPRSSRTTSMASPGLSTRRLRRKTSTWVATRFSSFGRLQAAICSISPGPTSPRTGWWGLFWILVCPRPRCFYSRSCFRVAVV